MRAKVDENIVHDQCQVTLWALAVKLVYDVYYT